DAFVNDPSERKPLCEEQLFATVLEQMVADNAPRLFAIVQEYGERVDAHIAAWGMAFDGYAELITTNRRVRMGLQHPEQALDRFHFGTHIHPRLIWHNPDAALPPEDDLD